MAIIGDIVRVASKQGDEAAKAITNKVVAEGIEKQAAKNPLWKKTGEALNSTGKFAFDLESESDQKLLTWLNQKNRITRNTDLSSFVDSYDIGKFNAQKAMYEGKQAKAGYTTRMQSLDASNPNEDIVKIQQGLRQQEMAAQQDAKWVANEEKIEQIKQDVNFQLGTSYEQPNLFDNNVESIAKPSPEPITDNINQATSTFPKANMHGEQQALFDEAPTTLQGPSMNTDNFGTSIIEDAKNIDSVPLTRQEQAAADLAYAEAADYTNTMPLDSVKAGYVGPAKARQIPLEEANTNDFNRIFHNMENNKKSVIGSLKQELGQNETLWSSTAKAALGTAVGGAALMAALSGSRGQQNNAQLYGQQPLY